MMFIQQQNKTYTPLFISYCRIARSISDKSRRRHFANLFHKFCRGKKPVAFRSPMFRNRAKYL